jgi:ribosome maturation factor RimP
VERKVKPEGEKRPRLVSEELAFNYDEIKYTKYLISFK